MKKHITQGGPFHYTYIAKVKDDNDGTNCGYYDNGHCKKDNTPCTKDNYCKYYDSEIIVETKKTNSKVIKTYTVEMFADNNVEEIKAYISDKDIYDEAERFSPESSFAIQLQNHQKGQSFIIGDAKYKIKDIEHKTIKS